jgi:tetratricopeptide (TPR) repeat protein
VISGWDARDGDSNALPALRLGEVAFLQGDYNEAAAQFGVAAFRARLLPSADPSLASQAQLDRGAALLKAGRTTEGVALLRDAEQDGVAGFPRAGADYDVAREFGAVSYHSAVQLGDYESATGDLHGAVDDYAMASSWTAKLNELLAKPEVMDNNLALAYLGIGSTERARDSAAKALETDSMNPVFLMTAGFVADRAGDAAAAADYDQRALASDPGSFAAANDLGVELARRHSVGAAEMALRQAVGAAPGYALGWFNLGVLESQRGPAHLLASQGAFARALNLDATLKDRRHELTIDGSVYRTALDLSKPLPPEWSLAQTQKTAPVTSASLLALALLGVGLAKSSNRHGIDLAKQFLNPVVTQLNKIQVPRWLQPPIWAVVGTVAAFLLTYLRHAGSPTETGAYCLAIVLMSAVAVQARTVVASRSNVVATQTSWLPGLSFGLLTGALGAPWAPLPVAATKTESPRVHLAAPLTLAVLSLVLFIQFAWLNIPLTQAVAIAALIMVGSTLLPIGPLDGANVGKSGVFAAAGVVAGAVLVMLGVV